MNTAVNGLKVRADGLKERASESATYALGLSKRIFYTTVISTVTVALIANASAFMYATFYYAFVPSPEHEAFVNPTFEPCGPTDDSMLRCGFLNATGDVGGATGPILMAGQVIFLEQFSRTRLTHFFPGQGLYGDSYAGHAGIAGEQEVGNVHELSATEVCDGRSGEGDVQVFDAAVQVVAVEAN